MSLYVRDLMESRVLTVEATSTVKNSAKMMNKLGVSCLIVSSEDAIVGIVTERDIITRVVASGQNPEQVTVGKIMSEPIIVVNADTPIEHALQIMITEKIKKLPVIEKKGEMVILMGMLSMTDIARIQPDLIESIKHLIGENAETMAELGSYIR